MGVCLAGQEESAILLYDASLLRANTQCLPHTSYDYLKILHDHSKVCSSHYALKILLRAWAWAVEENSEWRDSHIGWASEVTVRPKYGGIINS